MKKVYTFLAVILVLNSASAQWVAQDSTLTSTGNYSSLGWPQGVTITVPAGTTVNANISYGGGKLKVYGNLMLSGSSQINDSLLMGASAQMTVNGTLTTDNDVVIGEDAQLTTNGFSPNVQNSDSINVRPGATFIVNGDATINAGHLRVSHDATFTVTNNLNLNNPNNYFRGTVNVNNTLVFASGPNAMDCPGQITVKNLTNNSGSPAIDGTGFIKVTGTFTSPNAFTASNTIVMDIAGGSGNPGSATMGTTSPCSTGLPVTIKYFDVQARNGKVVLDWTTGSEINNSGFIIENSTDGIQFRQLSFVATKAVNGSSSSSLSYEYADNNPLPGTSYYRMQQKNTDGAISYTSGIVRVVTGGAGSVTLYPNPVTSTLHIAGDVNDGATYRVLNINGQIVIKAAATTIDVQSLPKGLYIVQEAKGSQVRPIGKFMK